MTWFDSFLLNTELLDEPHKNALFKSKKNNNNSGILAVLYDST